MYIIGYFEATCNFDPGGTANLTSAGLADIFMAKLNSVGQLRLGPRAWVEPATTGARASH